MPPSLNHTHSVRPIGLAALIGAAVLALSFTAGCRDSAEPSPPPIARVRVYEVSKQATGQSRRLSGKVESPDRSTLSFGVGGRLSEIVCEVGQAVVRGEILAQLDDEPLRITLENARASLTSSRANQLDALSRLSISKKLFAEGAASQPELDTATVALAQADGNLQSAMGTLAQAELDFGRTKLVAPYSGTVVSLEVDDFQEVSPSSTVVVLQSDQSLEVRIRVPETFIRDVDFGQVVQVAFPSLEGVTLQGTVVTIGAESETGNAFPVAVRLAETEEDLRAGITASVTFLFDDYLTDQSAYLVPFSAIAIDETLFAAIKSGATADARRNQASVYVLNTETGFLELRPVTAGGLRDNEIEIFEGLNEGDLVVTAGVAFLHDGMPAKAWTPSSGASDDE